MTTSRLLYLHGKLLCLKSTFIKHFCNQQVLAPQYHQDLNLFIAFLFNNLSLHKVFYEDIGISYIWCYLSYYFQDQKYLLFNSVFISFHSNSNMSFDHFPQENFV